MKKRMMLAAMLLPGLLLTACAPPQAQTTAATTAGTTTTVPTTTMTTTVTATTAEKQTTTSSAREPSKSIVKVVAGPGLFGAIDSQGGVYLWGSDSYGRTEIPEDLPPVTALGIGYRHVVALDAEGKLHGWGADEYGELGFVADGGQYIDATAHGYQTTALKADGSVCKWGGVNQGSQEYIPEDMGDIKKIYNGTYTTVAIDGEGKAYIWGVLEQEAPDIEHAVMAAETGTGIAILDNTGEIHGDVTRLSGMIRYKKKQETGLTQASRLFGSMENLAAIDETGKLYVWGNYLTHETGRSIVDVPEGLPPIAEVAMDKYTIVALGEDGLLYQWGGGHPPAEFDGFKGKDPFGMKPEDQRGIAVDAESFEKAAKEQDTIIVTGDVTVDLMERSVGIAEDQHLIIEEGASLTLLNNTTTIYGQLSNKGTLILGDGEFCHVMLFNPDIEFGNMIRGRATKTRCYMNTSTAVKDLKRAFAKENGVNEYMFTPGEGPYSVISIDEDLTIPYGKCVSLNMYAKIRVEKNCTLTIEGTLESYQDPEVLGTLDGSITQFR